MTGSFLQYNPGIIDWMMQRDLGIEGIAGIIDK
jgi:hypothetical protein